MFSLLLIIRVTMTYMLTVKKSSNLLSVSYDPQSFHG